MYLPETNRKYTKKSQKYIQLHIVRDGEDMDYRYITTLTEKVVQHNNNTLIFNLSPSPYYI